MADSNPPASSWTGLRTITARRGYTDTPMGQMHYSAAGDGPPVILLHQTPWFGVQYAKAQPLLAQEGLRVIVPDTPGYGFSDLPDHAPTADEYADNLAAFMDRLGLDQATLVGHHTGATLAAALAARHPGRVRGLVLHGVPLYTAEERADRLKNQLHPNTALSSDGGHLTARWKRVDEVFMRGTATAESLQWSVLSFYLAGPTEWYGHQAAFTFDMEQALRRVTAPTLIMSNTADTIHGAAARALKLRPDFAYHEFAGGNAHMMYDDPGPWAAIVAAFVKQQTRI
ncbi:MAG: alpha/beta hydrolase [Rhodospirillaceae bacterium]|nr:alpha/beta hydrolase [Rhodospirillaceae bacterium]